jgi:hypothetical protein
VSSSWERRLYRPKGDFQHPSSKIIEKFIRDHLQPGASLHLLIREKVAISASTAEKAL